MKSRYKQQNPGPTSICAGKYTSFSETLRYKKQLLGPRGVSYIETSFYGLTVGIRAEMLPSSSLVV